MSYVFVLSSEISRDLARYAQNYLEGEGIPLWMRDQALDRNLSIDDELVKTALKSAAAVIVVWQAGSIDNSNIQHDVAEARSLGIPVYILREFRELEPLARQLHKLEGLETGDTTPLPIPLVETVPQAFPTRTRGLKLVLLCSGLIVIGIAGAIITFQGLSNMLTALTSRGQVTPTIEITATLVPTGVPTFSSVAGQSPTILQPATVAINRWQYLLTLTSAAQPTALPTELLLPTHHEPIPATLTSTAKATDTMTVRPTELTATAIPTRRSTELTIPLFTNTPYPIRTIRSGNKP